MRTSEQCLYSELRPEQYLHSVFATRSIAVFNICDKSNTCIKYFRQSNSCIQYLQTRAMHVFSICNQSSSICIRYLQPRAITVFNICNQSNNYIQYLRPEQYPYWVFATRIIHVMIQYLQPEQYPYSVFVTRSIPFFGICNHCSCSKYWIQVLLWLQILNTGIALLANTEHMYCSGLICCRIIGIHCLLRQKRSTEKEIYKLIIVFGSYNQWLLDIRLVPVSFSY